MIKTIANSGQTAQDYQPFLHYSLKQRMVSWISRTLFDDLTYTVRHGLLKGMKRRGGLSWIPNIGGFFKETPEHRFFCSLHVQSKVVFDVGAFEGLITLFFARNAQHVVCYEPNPRNFARLCKNLELNRIQNVTVRNRRSEEHTSELQSQSNLVCRLLLEKKKQQSPNPDASR